MTHYDDYDSADEADESEDPQGWGAQIPTPSQVAPLSIRERMAAHGFVLTETGGGCSALARGTRVQLHAATSYWMQGDRYGTVVGHGRKREYVTDGDKRILASPVLVQLDKSGRTVRLHPDNVFALEDSE